MIELTVEVVKRRVPVIAGTGSNSTDEAISLTKHAKEAGADGALLITPYYNKPTQEGLYRHYKAVAEAVDIPLMLYNIPGRTGVNMLPATVARLAVMKNIVGIKEGSGSVQQASEIAQTCGDRLTVLAGDDASDPAHDGSRRQRCHHGDGQRHAEGDGAIGRPSSRPAASTRHAASISRYLPLFAALFYETNPIPGERSAGDDGQDRSGTAAAALCHGDGQSQPIDPRPERDAADLTIRHPESLTSMINVIVAGAAGRMGSRLVALIKESSCLDAGRCDRRKGPSRRLGEMPGKQPAVGKIGRSDHRRSSRLCLSEPKWSSIFPLRSDAGSSTRGGATSTSDGDRDDGIQCRPTRRTEIDCPPSSLRVLSQHERGRESDLQGHQRNGENLGR